MTALERALDIIARGNQSEFARQVTAAMGDGGPDLSPQLVSYWLNNGKAMCGPRYVMIICKLTNWQIQPHELRPDIFDKEFV